jgi:hypothetical protein
LAGSVSLFDIALGYGALAALGLVITLLTAKEPAAVRTALQPTNHHDQPRQPTAA